MPDQRFFGVRQYTVGSYELGTLIGKEMARIQPMLTHLGRQIQPLVEPFVKVRQSLAQQLTDPVVEQLAIKVIQPAADRLSNMVQAVAAAIQQQFIKGFYEQINGIYVAIKPAIDKWQKIREVLGDEKLKYLPAYLALRALYEGDEEELKLFITRWLGCPYHPDVSYAVYEALESSRWRQAENPIAYLRKTVKYKLRKEYRAHPWGGLGIPKYKAYSDYTLWVENGGKIIIDSYYQPIDKNEELELKDMLAQPDVGLTIEDKILLEEILNMMTPEDRKGWLLYRCGWTLKEAFGGENKADVAVRRKKKLVQKLNLL